MRTRLVAWAADHWIALLCSLVCTLPFLVVAWQCCCSGPDEITPAGDLAAIEIAVNHAARGTQLLGPYSRFGWHHPGPLLFYWLLPFYQLLGGGTAGLLLGAMVLSCLCLVTALLVVSRSMGTSGLLTTALVLVLAVHYAGKPEVTFSFWNPCVVVIPFLLLLLLAAALVSGVRAALPALILLGSFLVQTSISCAPVSLGVIAAALLGTVWRLRRSGSVAWQSWRTVAVVSLLLGLLLWLPPLVEEVGGEPGNLTMLWRFFSEDAPGQPLAKVADRVARGLTAIPLLVLERAEQGDPATGPAPLPFVVAALQMVLLFIVTVLALRRRQHFVGFLGVLTQVGILVSVLALLQVRGNLSWYLSLWVPMLGAVSWVCILGVASDAGVKLLSGRCAGVSSRACRCLVGSVAVVALAVLVWSPTGSVVAGSPVESLHKEWVAEVSTAVVEHYLTGEIDAPTLRIVHYWGVGAGVALQLLRRDLPFAVEEYRLGMFGRQLAPQVAFGDELLVCSSTLRKQLEVDPNQRLIADIGRVLVYHYREKPRPKPISSLSFGAQCQPYLRAGFTPDWEYDRSRAAAERWGTDRVMRLMLPLLEHTPYCMRLRCRPYPVAGKRQQLTVVVNGRELAVLSLSRKLRSYEVDIPADVVRLRNDLELRTGYCAVAGRDPLTGAVLPRSVAFESIEMESLAASRNPGL